MGLRCRMWRHAMDCEPIVIPPKNHCKDPCLIVWIPVWFQIVYRYPPEAGEFGWVFLHEARHRIDADDVLSKIDFY
jgi:hypothetical protein